MIPSGSASPAAEQLKGDCEVPYIRTYFYAGGAYVEDGHGGHVFRNQMYVEKLLPVNGATQNTPVVLIHGKGMTGTNFLNKPDGGRGWASDFVSQGYEVYIVDQVFRGRSAWQPGYGAGIPSTFSAEIVQDRFTATQTNRLWAQADKHTQWPGKGVMGDPVFDKFYASIVQFIDNTTYTEMAMQSAGAALLDKIGKPAILIGHSQGGTFPPLIADARPQLTKALILIEPTGPPFREVIFSIKPSRAWGLTDAPLTYSPAVKDPSKDLAKTTHPAPDKDLVECMLQANDPAPRQLHNLASKPILVLTSESGYHAQYDYCTVEFLRQAGCSKTEHIELGKIGIHGNGHMLFLEKNSRDIQELLDKWIKKL
ncbi:Uncharacterized protein TCAP_04823 [Tolypocladium capitatum]|uniref:AB hydrolase-1 domain-containing protein n=1 Tax=Tolypocladium capitatum TaxID=45235 RepID=A0A2K3QCI8_9HYPO|nr:Uncharacterized protein TCAP_04823 [Tolypocladium capitatum]